MWKQWLMVSACALLALCGCAFDDEPAAVGGAERTVIWKMNASINDRSSIDHLQNAVARRLRGAKIHSTDVTVEGDKLTVTYREHNRDDLKKVRKLLEEGGGVEIRPVADKTTMREVTDRLPIAGYRWYPHAGERRMPRLLVTDTPHLKDEHIENVEIINNYASSGIAVAVKLNEAGADILSDLTSKRIRQRLAVIGGDDRDKKGKITARGTLLVAPVVLQPTGATVHISGNLTREKAEDIAMAFKGGVAGMKLEYVKSQ